MSDKFDRRVVMAASTGALSIFIASFFGAGQFVPLLLFTMIFGGLTFSLYSLFTSMPLPSQMVAMSSSLMVNGAGATAGSPLRHNY